MWYKIFGLILSAYLVTNIIIPNITSGFFIYILNIILWTVISILIIKISQKGLTKGALSRIGKVLALTQKDLAELTAISLRTFQRYENDKKLNPIVSESMIQLTEIIRLGFDVFEDRDTFIKWLNTANKALGQRKPIELLKFRTGSDLVRNLLGQIQYGIVA